tara:strand:+ start:1711 stop:2169 length:459 start_codon:yes stop_codon:yes gene_type:complete
MALQGNINFTKTIEHPEGETETRVIYVPMDVAEDDPNYEHRGTKVESEEVKLLEVEDEDRSYEDVYLVINSCGFTQHRYGDNEKIWYLSIIYHIFLTAEDRELNPNAPHTVNDWTDMEWIDITSEEFTSTDIVTYAYNKLKSKKPFSEMIDV